MKALILLLNILLGILVSIFTALAFTLLIIVAHVFLDLIKLYERRR